MVTLQLRQISVPPGHRVLFHNVNWEEFEAILEEWGEHRGSRIAYSQGTLEIRMPLPEHEKAKIIIGYLVKILLEELEIEFEPFGSTTFKRKSMLQGIEPDECFYIQNYALMIGKKRIDLTGLEQNSSPNIAQTCYVCGKYVTIILEPTDKSIRYGCSKS